MKTTARRRSSRSRLSAEDSFTLLVARRLLSEGVADETEVLGPLSIRAILGEDWELEANLDNLWLLCRQDPESRDEYIAEFFRAIRQAGPEGESCQITADQIVPIVRDDGYIAQAARSFGDHFDELVRRPLAADLWVLYGIDRPDAISNVTRGILADLGVVDGALQELAATNLRRIVPEIEFQRHASMPIGMLLAGGTYESSLLLLPEVWEELAGELRGRPVVSVPARDVLLFADSSLPGAVTALAELSAKMYGSCDHVISCSLLIWEEGVWNAHLLA